MRLIKSSLIMFVLVLCTACTSTPKPRPSAYPSAHTQPRVVAYALSLQGAPYRYGKASPSEGFDCSGFVSHVYARQGIVLPRTAHEMAAILPAIPDHLAQPGDLLFFDSNGTANSHVGIYVEQDRFIHAPSQRTGKVVVSSLKNSYWQKHYQGVRRPLRQR